MIRIIEGIEYDTVYNRLNIMYCDWHKLRLNDKVRIIYQIIEDCEVINKKQHGLWKVKDGIETQITYAEMKQKVNVNTIVR